MSKMVSQITSLTIVYWTIYSGADQRKHQSYASLAFVRGIHRWPVNSPTQMASNAENVSISWCHHGIKLIKPFGFIQIYHLRSPFYGEILHWSREVFKLTTPSLLETVMTATLTVHDDVIKWNHFPHCWSFVRVTGGFSSQRPVTRSFDVFFDVRLNNWLSKQSRCQWFKMPSRHPNVIVAYQCFQYWYDSHIHSIVHKLNCYTSTVKWGNFLSSHVHCISHEIWCWK